MAYDNTNRGIVGKNDRKQKDTHPDITGSINVEGVDYFLDGWKKQRNDGFGSFYSLSVKRKDRQPSDNQSSNTGGYDRQNNGAGSGGGFGGDVDDTDIPF